LVTDTFQVRVTDDQQTSSSKTLTVNLSGANDAPTSAAGQSLSATIDLVPYVPAQFSISPTDTRDLINSLGGSAGFGENVLAVGDDNSSGAIDITSIFPGGLKFFGRTFNSLYINNNGTITFDGPDGTTGPTSLFQYGHPIIAPFWAN